MNKTIKRKWIKALRSGEYAQGEGNLKCGPNLDGEMEYCCLGVLRAICPELKLKKSGEEEMLTPKSTEEKIGLTYKQQIKLAKMNDSGRSFNYIATYIERFL